MLKANNPVDLIISARSACELFDMISAYQDGGYYIVKLWYRTGWLWYKRFYARLEHPSNKGSYIAFKVGPISSR